MTTLLEKIARKRLPKKTEEGREFAPGLPRKTKVSKIPSISKPKAWSSVIQRHDAERAGLHFDLRLGDPKTRVGHSWALRYLPEPGEKRLAIQQPDHTLDYFKFQGTIPAGYGKGKVRTHDLSDAEILESSPGKVIFNRYVGKDTHEYALIQTKGKQWLLINRTPTGKTKKLPVSKPKYREIKPAQADPNKPGRWDAKIDGAHLIYDIEGGKPIRAFSYRKSKRGPALIQHTFRIPGLSGKKAPRGFKHTQLRGEVYAIDPKTKKAIKAHELGGMLNSNVIKSRRAQKSKGKFINTIFDIVKFDGKDVSGFSTEEKRKLIKQVLARPGIKGIFHTPPSATTPKAKQALFDKIRKGQLKQTKEGIIIHSPEGVMTKVKFKSEWDVRISGIFTKPRSKAKGMAGGFTYNVVNGKKIRRKSRVGTGFTHELRRAMLENPEDFIGVIAKVTGAEQHASGAIRAPSFQGWHLDKNDPDRIPEIKR